jgi:SAM-dependent methyltransferase
MTDQKQPLCLDIGCGKNKKPGFTGVDKTNLPGVDNIVDFEHEKLPFPNDSVDAIFSSHCLEHIPDPHLLLSELLRVGRNGSACELWLPHLRSNEAFVFDHRMYYNELIISRISATKTDFWFPGTEGAMRLNRIVYVLKPGIEEMIRGLAIPPWFAIKHLFNIIIEWGLFFTLVKEPDFKGHAHFKSIAEKPEILLANSRQGPFKILEAPADWWEIK